MTAPVVVIRGLGLITPLGVGVEATWHALLAEEFIGSHARCRAAEEPLAPSPGTPATWQTGARVHALARYAAGEALASACWTRAGTAADSRTALVAATSRGPADQWLTEAAFPEDAAATAPPPSGRRTSDNPEGEFDPSFGLSAVSAHVARSIGHGIGPRLTLSGACAGGLHALVRAVLLLEHGDADRAVVVAAESSLHPMFLQSFRRLGVLAADGDRCRPFDVNRSGFLCAEAAAAVVLERAAEPRPGDVWVDRYGLAGDAAHLTGSDPAGTTLRRLLARAIDGRPVDVIHAHGTGTVANDAAESAAIDSVLAEVPGAARRGPPARHDPPVRPNVYSHKGAIGHTVGAAGLVSIVLNVLMHRRGVVPPNVGVETPIPVRHAAICPGAVERPVHRSVACAAGFGGATATVSMASAG